MLCGAIRNCMNFTPPAPDSQAGYLKHLILFQRTFLSSGIKRLVTRLDTGKSRIYLYLLPRFVSALFTVLSITPVSLSTIGLNA